MHNGNATENTTDPMINLKGIMVGNGVTNWAYDAEACMVDISYWHGLVPRELQVAIKEAKCDWSGLPFGDPLSEDCETYIDEFDTNTELINMYNLYGTCWGAEPQEELNQFSMYELSKAALAEVTDKSSKKYPLSMYTPWTRHHKKKVAKQQEKERLGLLGLGDDDE